MKAEKLPFWKNLQTENVHQRVAARTASPGLSRGRKMRKRHTFRLRLPGEHPSAPDPPGLGTPRTQASAGLEVPILRSPGPKLHPARFST